MTNQWILHYVSPMIVPLQNATRLVLQNAPSNYLLINENNLKIYIYIYFGNSFVWPGILYKICHHVWMKDYANLFLVLWYRRVHFINKKGYIPCSVVCSIILTGRAFCKWELGDWNNMCPSSHHILHLAHSEGFSFTGGNKHGKYAQITNHYKSKLNLADCVFF